MNHNQIETKQTAQEHVPGTYQRGSTGQNAPRTLQQFAPLINKYAFKFHRRAVGLSCAMDIDDIKQELSIIFLKCVGLYDDTKGGSFMNYLISAMYHEMNRLFSRDQRNREVCVTVAQFTTSDDGEMSDSIFDRVDSGWATPEENYEAIQCLSALLNSLSPEARAIVQQIVDPSPAILEQFELQERGSAAVREAGASVRATLQLNLNFMFNLLDIPRSVSTRITREVRQQTERTFLLEAK